MTHPAWVVAQHRPLSPVWDLCATCGSLEGAHARLAELKAVATLRGAPPTAWMVTPEPIFTREHTPAGSWERVQPPGSCGGAVGEGYVETNQSTQS
jgi:hypothetical protein